MDIQGLCRPLEQMELTLAALYQEFSRVFAREDQEASELFAQMAREEKSHHAMIQFEVRLMKKNPSLKWDLGLELDAVNAVVREAEELRRAAPRMTVKEALEASLRLEQSDAENHIRDTGGNVPDEISNLLAKLRAGDMAHRKTLESFAQRRGLLGKTG